jgi:hypothetical protein
MIINRFGIIFIQLTWGGLQTGVGFILFLLWIGTGNLIGIERYKSAIVLRIKHLTWGVSLGLFIFIGESVYQSDSCHTIPHEYGHCIQSAFLGPLYLFVIGIFSGIWFLTFRYRLSRAPYLYYTFWTERWADQLGGVNRIR